MRKFEFLAPENFPEDKLEVVVIAARYRDKWLFCRHKERDTWEMPGGHIEHGESARHAAMRELWEETGAVDADTTEVLVCSDDKYCGLLFFAEVHKLGELPENSEMAEVGLFDYLPESLTYPELCHALFAQTQAWRNIQSNAGEVWDVYDGERNKTGKLHRRGDRLPEGEYHLVVHVWLRNSRGEYLITKRTPNKGFPNMWESTGGSALAGDDSIRAAVREVKEETGLDADPACGRCIMSFRRSDNFVDVWLFCQDFDLGDVVLQEGETCDKAYATREQIEKLTRDGRFVPYSYLTELLDLADKV